MKRRLFITRFSLGWVITSLSVIVSSCFSKSNENKVESSNLSNSKVDSENTNTLKPIGTITELDSQGKIQQKTALGAVVVIRNPNNPSEILAVNSTCPHKGCIVEWNSAQKEFACPCHNSTFAPDGKLIKGVAKTSLKTYEVNTEKDAIFIKA